MKPRKWQLIDLEAAVKNSTSVRQVLSVLGLREAGGNYSQIKKRIQESGLDSTHFTGKGWNRGLKFVPKKRIPIEELLQSGSNFQSYKLKKRLFEERIKLPQCEECGWKVKASDGRVPLEVHHKNGDGHDNRIYNLQILCPNCHSLKPNYRGCNIKKN